MHQLQRLHKVEGRLCLACYNEKKGVQNVVAAEPAQKLEKAGGLTLKDRNFRYNMIKGV